MKKQYDVVIIGAGVVGSAIARELSRYKLSIAVLEKNLDVCNETSGRNSAVVHGGFANPIGSLKAKCCVEGNRIMGQLAEELNFPFKRCGKVLVGNTPEDMEQLERTMKQGAVNGCTGLEMIDEAKLHELVPAVVGKFAMWSKNSGIMDPFLYTVALAENAHANGVDFFFDHKVEAITRENELYYLHTAHGDFCTRWVVNAAGLGAKQISDLLGLTGYRVIGSRSNYIILHKRMGKLLPMPVYPVPSNTYMGDNLSKIAAKYGTTVDALAEINAIKNKNLIRVGQVLMLQDTPQAAADKLEALGVINSPDYWAEAAEAGKVQYLDILLKKAAQTITKAGVRTDTPQEGVAALVAAGVINTPEYWLANYGTFPSLDLLLQALGGAVK